MSADPHALARLVAFVIWADERIDRAEWAAAEELFTSHGCDWQQGQRLLEDELDKLESDWESVTARAERELPRMDLPEGFEARKLLLDLSVLAVADGEIDATEVAIVHALAAAIHASPREATIALLLAARETGATISL